jgi:glycosyltransferase involved in cell wall biosynthesis
MTTKILYFIHTFGDGEKNGTAIHVKNLIKFLPNEYQSTVISGKGKSIPFFSALRIPTFEILRGLTTKCDIIHVHGYGNFFSFFGALLAIVKNVPLVWTLHGYPRISGKRKILYYVYKYFMAPLIIWKASKIISVSDDAAALLRKETNKEIMIMPNGVDLEMFVSKRHYKEASHACYIGRLDEDKKAERLFETSLPLSFIGPNEDGVREKLTMLQSETMRNISFSEVEYHQMPVAYDHCRYVVLPSKYEGFPLTLLEAIAMGRPFICTDVGQVKKTFYELGLGEMFLLKDGENIGAKIELLEKTVGIDEALATARILIAYKYSWRSVCDRLAVVYMEAKR